MKNTETKTRKFIRVIGHTPNGNRCLDGNRNIGSHLPGSKWADMDYFLTTFLRSKQLGQEFGMKQFQTMYQGLMLAAGFAVDYAIEKSAECHLKNGPVNAGLIEIVEVADNS